MKTLNLILFLFCCSFFGQSQSYVKNQSNIQLYYGVPNWMNSSSFTRRLGPLGVKYEFFLTAKGTGVSIGIDALYYSGYGTRRSGPGQNEQASLHKLNGILTFNFYLLNTQKIHMNMFLGAGGTTGDYRHGFSMGGDDPIIRNKWSENFSDFQFQSGLDFGFHFNKHWSANISGRLFSGPLASIGLIYSFRSKKND